MTSSAGAPAGSGYEPAPAIGLHTGGAGAWSCVDIRTIDIALTRKYFRELPYRFVLVPVLDGPVLVFPERHQARAACLAADIQHQAVRYQRAFDPYKRASLTNYIRRLHLRRVSLAVGYTWPGNPPGWIEFAECP